MEANQRAGEETWDDTGLSKVRRPAPKSISCIWIQYGVLCMSLFSILIFPQSILWRVFFIHFINYMLVDINKCLYMLIFTRCFSTCFECFIEIWFVLLTNIDYYHHDCHAVYRFSGRIGDNYYPSSKRILISDPVCFFDELNY